MNVDQNQPPQISQIGKSKTVTVLLGFCLLIGAVFNAGYRSGRVSVLKSALEAQKMTEKALAAADGWKTEALAYKTNYHSALLASETWRSNYTYVAAALIKAVLNNAGVDAQVEIKQAPPATEKGLVL
jgi:hypothetical protein